MAHIDLSHIRAVLFDLDGVLIETTTHARAWITIQALQMGMDCYIEKPMCLTIEEGQAMVARLPWIPA